LFIPEAQILFAAGEIERPEPIAMFFPPRVLLVHVVQNEVCDHAHPVAVRVLDQFV
jgi:hypothetical protein